MASISKDTDGNIRILFIGADKKRRAIRLGQVNRKLAETIKLRVETLAASLATKTPLDGETANWTAQIGDEMAQKLAAVGLMPQRAKAITLAGLLDVYLNEKEADNKSGTKTNHRTVSNDLTGFFGENTNPSTITREQAKTFLDHLRTRELAGGTVARRITRVRSIFAHGVRRKLLLSNPFDDVKTMAALPPERKVYVSVGDTRKLLDASTPIWRTIIALARFAGMRCPSEVLMLKWSDVNFETGRMTIPSCKTEHIPGKAYRVAPIFAELRQHLADAFELAAPGEVYVVGTKQGDAYRESAQGPNGWLSCNLRTQMLRLIKRAGLKPWPRLFNTLRASCETDLMEQFPISAVTEWLGHSATTALKHYARVPDALYERAANGDAESGALVAQNAAQTAADAKRPAQTDLAEVLENQAFRPVLSAPVLSSPNDKMTLRRFELRFLP